jgi:hypothetical protein
MAGPDPDRTRHAHANSRANMVPVNRPAARIIRPYPKRYLVSPCRQDVPPRSFQSPYGPPDPEGGGAWQATLALIVIHRNADQSPMRLTIAGGFAAAICCPPVVGAEVLRGRRIS